MTAGFFNPDPIILEEVDRFESEFLSRSKLQEISGCDDLSKVTSLVMDINTKKTTLGNFGQYLPALKHLTLNGSFIPSVRDIGTSFHFLTVLYLCECNLSDVDGISAMQNLEELHISHNDVVDASPVSFLDQLKVLNAEWNQISDIEQIDYFALMPDLVCLNLLHNPITDNFTNGGYASFENYVEAKVPNLLLINGKAFKKLQNPSLDGSVVEITIADEAHKVDKNNSTNFMKNAQTLDQHDKLVSFSPRISTTKKHSSASNFVNVSKSVDFSSTIFSPPGSSEASRAMLHDASSILTFGNPLSGNPMQALLERKKAPPSPVLSKFNKGKHFEKSPRPSTAPVRRRRVRAITGDQLKVLETNIRKSLSVKQSSQIIATAEISGYLKTPSPPKQKVKYLKLLFNVCCACEAVEYTLLLC